MNMPVEDSFQYFFAKFLNKFDLIRTGIEKRVSFAKLKEITKDNINDFFIIFIETFSKFDFQIKDFRWTLEYEKSHKL